jgi:hypothetical protein
VTSDLTLYARWEEKQCLVRFVDYDNTILFSGYVTYGTSAQNPQDPVRSGYTFIGWDHSFSCIVDNITITAQYEINYYTVTFNTDGGSLIEPVPDVPYNSSITLPVPMKDNFVFLGWQLNGTSFTSDSVVADDITLDAIWTPYFDYQIFFDTQGGNIIHEQTVPTYSTVNSLPVAEKTDFIFDGWLLDGEIVELPFLYDFKQNITLMAKWKGLADGIESEIVGGEAKIVRYTGLESELMIPDTINGYHVTEIKANAFKDNALLTKVTLGKYVLRIGDSAFSNMTSLKEVVLPCSATMIGANVFYGCNSLESMTLSGSRTFELRYLFGNNINYIPESLTKIKFANGTGSIDKTMFLGNMKNATTIELPDDMTYITSQQFEGMTFLTRVIIPDSLTEIGIYAFYGCTNLKVVEMGKGVTNIGKYAFCNCYSLSDVAIPDGVTVISEHAFSSCNFTKELVIPAQVTAIEDYAFYGNNDVPLVVIPDTLISMGNRAFNSCSTTILVEALDQPYGWDYEWYDDSTVIYGYIETRENDVLKYAITQNNTVAIMGLSSSTSQTQITIPDAIDGAEVNLITLGAFMNNSQIKSVSLPNTITKILEFTFFKCINLENVTFGENSQIDTICQFAFYGCSSLQRIMIPRCVTSIQYCSFSYCSNLKSVVIPSETFVSNDAFSECDMMTAYAEAPSKPSTWGDYWVGYDRPVMWGIKGYGTTEGLDYVISPDDQAIILGRSYDNSQTSIVIPSTIESRPVTTILAYAFYGSQRLTSVFIPISVTTIGAYALFASSNLKIYAEAPSKPSGWAEYWKPNIIEVQWSYQPS